MLGDVLSIRNINHIGADTFDVVTIASTLLAADVKPKSEEGNMSQVELALMTWKEAGAARDRGAVVLIPVGTLEQNGSVCTLGTDTITAVEVANRVAKETGAVVAPVIGYGYSPQFRHFPGTVSLKPDTLRSLLFEVCQNMIENGFTRLLVVNCHMTNEPIIEHALRDVREQLGVLTAAIQPINLALGAIKDLYQGKESALGHGAEPIASMMRSFAPDAVRIEAAKADAWKQYQGLTVVGSSRVKVGGGTYQLFFNTNEAAEAAGTGDPSASDPERGAEIMRRVVSLISEFVRAFAKLKVKDDKK